ncbi:MAG: hypothetical protein HUK14_11220 [Muribaculaceae bacterium]|nr:hypothetical protein [Muribaculaceae bacterium]
MATPIDGNKVYTKTHGHEKMFALAVDAETGDIYTMKKKTLLLSVVARRAQ